MGVSGFDFASVQNLYLLGEIYRKFYILKKQEKEYIEAKARQYKD